MERIRKAVFPIAGLGTRFLPATKAVPKEMLPLVDRPLIQYAVEEAISAGVDEFIFVTAPGRDAVRTHFAAAPALEAALRDNRKMDLLARVRASDLSSARMHFIPQLEPLGLGHAVLCARDFVGDEPFAVMLPDDVIMAEKPCLAQMVDHYPSTGGHMMAAQEVEWSETGRYGIFDVKDLGDPVTRACGVIEKPAPEYAPSRLAVIGRYILDPSIFEALAATPRSTGGEIQLTDAIAAEAGQSGVYAFRFRGDRFDCGSKLGFLQATVAFGLKDESVGAAFAETLYKGFSRSRRAA
jgi:UTP--glucose-1-phosphate uridylyltransferase